MSEFEGLKSDKASKVVFHVVENEVETGGHPGNNQTLKFDDIGVIKLVQNQDFSGHESDGFRV